MTVTYSSDPILRWRNDLVSFVVEVEFTATWRGPLRSTVIQIPAGFVTDLASLPRVVTLFNPKLSRHLQPAIVHDYCYRTATLRITQEDADQIFVEGMEACGVGGFRRSYMYAGVRLRGSHSYVPRQDKDT